LISMPGHSRNETNNSKISPGMSLPLAHGAL
jgi:hypothetical protein